MYNVYVFIVRFKNNVNIVSLFFAYLIANGFLSEFTVTQVGTILPTGFTATQHLTELNPRFLSGSAAPAPPCRVRHQSRR